MSQHDFNIANQLFPATRADLNLSLVALASNSSGDAEPSTTYANQWWYETDSNTLKIRNEANSDWVIVLNLDADQTSSASELSQLDAITRGSILYGNASGATARLAKGGAGTVLSSDGTDISWGVAQGVPTGMILPYTTATDPVGFLECDGAAVSRTTYSALFGIISDDYGAGDGSATFNLPDLRGEFIRGFANGSTNDPDRASRTTRGDGTTGDNVGTKQGYQLQSHTHTYSRAAANNRADGGSSSMTGYGTNTTDATGGNETRPRNVQLMYCIKT